MLAVLSGGASPAIHSAGEVGGGRMQRERNRCEKATIMNPVPPLDRVGVGIALRFC